MSRLLQVGDKVAGKEETAYRLWSGKMKREECKYPVTIAEINTSIGMFRQGFAWYIINEWEVISEDKFSIYCDGSDRGQCVLKDGLKHICNTQIERMINGEIKKFEVKKHE